MDGALRRAMAKAYTPKASEIPLIGGWGGGGDLILLAGLADGLHGLYHETWQEIDIDASLPVTISAGGPQSVPDSTSFLMTAITLLGICCAGQIDLME